MARRDYPQKGIRKESEEGATMERQEKMGHRVNKPKQLLVK